ncbi:acyl-CoA dehydrogenase family protein [Chloroflexota bacterium]
MDFHFTEEQRHLMEEVCSFLKKEVSAEVVKETESWLGRGPHSWEFMRKVGLRGWLCPTWPKQYGGLESSNIDRLIIWDEISFHRAMELWVGARMAGPTILLFGSDEQKSEYLPPIARGEIDFAAGFTEPDAGSDLASIRLRAVEDGDQYILNGQKTFSSGCHVAQYHWLGARTDVDAPRHRGLSLFIVDIKSPGITMRPQWTFAGWRTNEVFYDNVRVPKKNMVGERNRGFYYLATSLDFDRATLTGHIRRDFGQLVEYGQQMQRHGVSLGSDPLVRKKLAELAIEVEIVRCLTHRHAWLRDRGLVPNYEASMIKMFSTELEQRLFQCGVEMLGLYGQLQEGSKWAPLNGRVERGCRSSTHGTIFGGTSQIMRNIIALRGLGLPEGG